MTPLTPADVSVWLAVIAKLVDLGVVTWDKIRDLAKDEGADDAQLAEIDRRYTERIARREREAQGW